MSHYTQVKTDFDEGNKAELIEAINKYLYPGDSILIKGSNRVFWAHKFVDRLTESLI